MVRSFRPAPLPPGALDRILDAGRRAPAAGNTDARALVVLEGAEQAERYWSVTLPPDRRSTFRWPGLLRAPALVVVCVRPGSYLARYGEPDKATSGLGSSEQRWPVPYWWVDTGAAVMAMLLAADGEGLGSLFFGLFDHEPALLASLGVPPGWRAAGTIALGRPDGGDEPGRSAGRGRPSLDSIVHRGAW